jgi:L-asparaginase
MSTGADDRILFIQTGGTIDKDYPRSTGGYAFEFGDEPATARLLERLQPSFRYRVVTAFRKDSLEVTDDDRQALVDLIVTTEENRIVITHGTDTMIETAKYLADSVVGRGRVPDVDKAIVLTGAMRPERFTNSDASINFGAAVAAVQLIPPGSVYVTMHGIVRPASEATRNMETGQFI